jgi:beta-1,2-mannobiose phosphorylase / 1,2-beta-oligomannan phosphorylase
MVTVARFPGNPILSPNPKHPWESEAAFNGCPIVGDDGCHLLFRATSSMQNENGITLELSTIGHAISFDRVKFLNHRQLIKPEYSWEQYGCEDPRVTYFDGIYYIFYTAISQWPPAPMGISVALATTRDLHKIDKKTHITPFNAKAMTLFPERINGKVAALLTANPDIPPSTIGVVYGDSISDFTDKKFWTNWYSTLPDHAVPLLRTTHDHVEIGAPPIKIPQGWLLIYSYIKSYLTSHKFFGIEAALLDADNPQKILKRTTRPLLYPEYDYELIGKIPNVIFPSGALIYNNNLGIYYGATDTTVCLATCSLDELLDSMS